MDFPHPFRDSVVKILRGTITLTIKQPSSLCVVSTAAQEHADPHWPSSILGSGIIQLLSYFAF